MKFEGILFEIKRAAESARDANNNAKHYVTLAIGCLENPTPENLEHARETLNKALECLKKLEI